MRAGKSDDASLWWMRAESSWGIEQQFSCEQGCWTCQGYNATLLTYGQTGSGKSLMIRYGANRCLVPLVCEEIFKATQHLEKNKRYQVRLAQRVIYFQDLSRLYFQSLSNTFKVLEICNDQVMKPLCFRINKSIHETVKNLLNLAGSDRQKFTGSDRDRLKEGMCVNLSLTTLGNVIRYFFFPNAFL
ncbi:LOW QUALITY PROTEIN: kinesin-like protein KIF28P [Alca torda]